MKKQTATYSLQGMPYGKEEIANLVKKEVQNEFGRLITNSRDCIELSEDVYRKTKCRLNQNTLRRLFGLVKFDYLPSWTTLDILSKYCGFESYGELFSMKSGPDENSGNFTKELLLNYLVSLFRKIPVKEYNDETFMALVKRTILFLQEHSELSDQFQRAIAKTSNGQNYYFEQFINIDGLNSFYGRGLMYYLNEKKTTEAQIFGHSLLCLKGWFTCDHDYLNNHFGILKQHQLERSIHPFVCGRYFASHIYHAHAFESETGRILENARQVHATIKPSRENYRSFPGFEFVFSLSLMLTGNCEEALRYTDYANKNYNQYKHSYVEDGYYQILLLVRGISFACCGNLDEAGKIFEQLQPSEFYFITRKVNMILYLFLKKMVKGLTESDQQLVDMYIRETGYVKFKHLNHISLS